MTETDNFNPFVPTVSTFAVRETQSLGQQMFYATVGLNGLKKKTTFVIIAI